MCYSLEASLIAGTGLAIAGYGMVSKALRDDPPMLAFAAFPLIFSVHQFIEAGVWATLSDARYAYFFSYVYSVIAFCLWPTLTPYAAAYAEPDPARRKLWAYLCVGGVVLSAWFLLQMINKPGIELAVVNHSLAYEPAFDRPPPIVDALYVMLSVFPLIASRRGHVALFGWTVLATLVWALAHNRPAWYSIWCMAAALLSLILGFAIEKRRSADSVQPEN